MVNDTLTIVMNDGNIITKAPATSEDFNIARACTTEACLINLVSSQEVKDERRKAEAAYEKAAAVKRGAEYLATLDQFEMKNNALYLKGINRTLPPLLVEGFLEVVGKHGGTKNDEFNALHRFFMWCCLNPRAEVADKLFNFLKKNSFKITKQGFFTALRNVVTIHGGTELVQFVSETYNKVKAVWKKSPDKYTVFLEDGEYSIVHDDDLHDEEWTTCGYCYGDGCDDEDSECPTCQGEGGYDDVVEKEYGEKIGNLTELYMDLPNRTENRFTDAHTETFDIRVGKVVHMDPAACRWNTDDCGAEGLHFTSDEIHYVGCGDQSVLVLINPMKVVGIGESKGRCWEYLPIMTVPRDEATTLLHDLDFDALELDEEFTIKEMIGLKDKVLDGFTAEAKKYSVNFPTVSMEEVSNIVDNLNRMQYIISARVNKI
jgi:hypothetical protein